MGLQDLSVETIVTILRSLDVQDILNLRCVCCYMDQIVLGSILYTGKFHQSMNDRLWSRLLFEKIAHDVPSHECISWVVSRLRSLSATQCCAEECVQAISAALVSYKGRAWVTENLDRILHWAETWDDLAIMVSGAWLGLRDVVRQLLEKGVQADESHKYLGSAMYAAAFNDDEILAELLLDYGASAWKMDGAYGDALQLAAYRGSKNVARRLIEAHIQKDASPNHFGYGPYGSPLAAAAAAGYDDLVRLCSQWQPNPRSLGPYLRSALFYAARSGRPGVVKILLDGVEMRPNLDDDFNDTPLSVAVEHNHEDVVSILLGSDKVKADHPGAKRTPLQIAAANGNTNIVRMLLRRHDVEIGGRGNGKPPILLAALNGHTEIVKLLLTQDRGPHIQRFLPAVASHGFFDMVKVALDSQVVDPNGYDNEVRTALHHAVGRGHKDMVRILLERNETTTNMEDSKGRTPLVLALQSRNMEIFRSLLDDKRTCISNVDSNGTTPLHIACERGYLSFVECILTRDDVNVNILDATGQTPLCYAIHTKRAGIVQLLLQNENTDINHHDSDRGKTPLYIATDHGDFKLATMLIQRYGANPNYRCDEYLATPLMIAATRGDLDLMSLLIKQDIMDINIPNKIGRTALDIAASHARVEATFMLLQHPDVNVHRRAKDGTTAFLMAARGGNLDILVHLLLRGADPSAPNDLGETPIYVASGNGHYEAVLMLLQQPDVNPNQPTYYRETPLSVAARRGHVAVVRLLLEQGGVKFNIQCQSSQRLLSVVSIEIIQLLVDAGDRFGEAL